MSQLQPQSQSQSQSQSYSVSAIKKLSPGTRIYLKKKPPHALIIQPGKILSNDNLYVAYDVKVDGQTVIPKDTRVVGDWVTETRPSISAQLQTSKIYLCTNSPAVIGSDNSQVFQADSDVISATARYDPNELPNQSYARKITNRRTVTGINRRAIADPFRQCNRTLTEVEPTALYLEIATDEIPVTLKADFIPFPCI